MPPAVKILAALGAFFFGPAVVIAFLGWHAWLLVVPAGATSATIAVLLGAWVRRRRNTQADHDDGP